MNAVSFINLASVRALEEAIGEPVDPLRFRANVYVDGLPAFDESFWLDRSFTIGGAEFRGVLPTKRCAATEVNPVTARRDLPIPRLLMQHFGHSIMGMYATTVAGGRVARGDQLHFHDGKERVS